MKRILISVMAIAALSGCTMRYERVRVEGTDIECDVKIDRGNSDNNKIHECVRVVPAEVTP